MRITATFSFGDVVYLRCRTERSAGMITAVFARPNGTAYGVTWGDKEHETTHYDFELSTEFLPDYSTS